MLHVPKNYGINAKNPIELVSPLQFFRNLFYWNLDAYAHAKVSVPPGQNRAIITTYNRSNAKRPSALRNKTINNTYFVFCTTLVSLATTIYLVKKYPAKGVTNLYHRGRDFFRRKWAKK